MSDKRRAVKQRLRSAGEDGADPWPDEPGEFDPDSLGPDRVAADAEDAGAGPVADAFWSAVVLANVGLLAVSVGPMFAYFQGRVLLGAALFVVGAVALYRTYRIRDRVRNGEVGDGTDDDGGDGA